MKRLILIILAFVIISPVFAQVTITQSDFLALVGQAHTRSTYDSDDQGAMATLIAKAGAGQTWDLSGLTFTPTGTAYE